MTDKRRGQMLVLIQFALLVSIIVIPQGELWPVDKILGGIAALVIVTGLIIALLGIMGLGASLTASPVPKERAILQTKGVYAFVRHPIYSGISFFAIGVVIGGASLWKIIMLILLAGLFTVKSRFEERLLLRKYPEYKAYAARVGRFIPGIGKISTI